MRMRVDLRDDAGLIGKIIVAWLLVLALAVIAVIDTGSILVTRFRAEASARTAAAAAAEAFRATGDDVAARTAAEQAIAADDVTLAGFAILDDGRARVVVEGEPSTIVAERIAPFVGEWGRYAEVRVKAIAAPSGG